MERPGRQPRRALARNLASDSSWQHQHLQHQWAGMQQPHSPVPPPPPPPAGHPCYAWDPTPSGCPAVMYAAYPAAPAVLGYHPGMHHTYPVAVIYPPPGWLPYGYTDSYQAGQTQHRRNMLPATRHDRNPAHPRPAHARNSRSAAGGQASTAGCARNSSGGASIATCSSSVEAATSSTSGSGVTSASTSSDPDPTVCMAGWSSLTAACLQAIVLKLVGSGVKHLRLVCRHWRAVVDHDLETLTPSEPHTRSLCQRFPNLKVLHLTHCANIRNRDLFTISGSNLALHTLTLGDDSNKPWVTNEGLACVARITSLTSLSLHDCNGVTNNGMAALTKLQQLSSLSLQRCGKLTSAALAAFEHHAALTSLQLRGCRLTSRGLAPLLRLQLVSLHLGDVRVRDEGLAIVACMTSLQELHVDQEEVSNAGVAQLTSLTRLESLALRDCRDVSGDALSVLVPALPRLRSLDLYKHFSLTDSQLLQCLAFLGALTFLDLRGTPVTEGGIKQLTRLSALQKLCLAPAQEYLWSPYLCVVSSLTQLTSLSINNCTPMSFGQLDALQQLKLLRELDLSHDSMQDQALQLSTTAIQSMAGITTLTSLDLSRRPVYPAHLSTLAERLPRLHSLIIVGCPVQSSEVQTLQRRFPDLLIHRKPLCDVSSCSSSDYGIG